MNEDFSPVFVGGYMRSGTTLLRTLLDRHPDLAVSNEFAMLWPTYKWPSSTDYTHEKILEVWREKAIEHGMDVDALLTRYKTYPPTIPFFFRAAIEEYAALHGKIRGGEKTPENIQWAHTLFRWFPQSRMVLIVRDPRGVFASVKNAKFNSLNEPVHQATLWAIASKEARRLGRSFKARIKIIRYEDLITQTENCLREIMPWLGLSYDPIQLDYRSPTPKFNAQDKPHMFLASKPVKIERLDAWKQDLSQAELVAIETTAKKQMQYWGYSPISLPLNIAVRLKIKAISWVHYFFFHPKRRQFFSQIKQFALKRGLRLDFFRK